mmetsp:Transcript_19000/g.27394  ORF Transcript_19000/g.27394 Transcript_19000/m.27394 type:complete len:219 (-) Transcript_19000:11-667(-)
MSVKALPSSTLSLEITPSSTSIDKRLRRVPPKEPVSKSRPVALAKAAPPSASMVTLSSAPSCFPQAPITKGSFTEMQQTVSTPLALMSSATSMNPGRWVLEQVGVKAPGSPQMATFLPANSSEAGSSEGFPSARSWKTPSRGILSPSATIAKPWLFPPRDLACTAIVDDKKAWLPMSMAAKAIMVPIVNFIFLTSQLRIAQIDCQVLKQRNDGTRTVI